MLCKVDGTSQCDIGEQDIPAPIARTLYYRRYLRGFSLF